MYIDGLLYQIISPGIIMIIIGIGSIVLGKKFSYKMTEKQLKREIFLSFCSILCGVYAVIVVAVSIFSPGYETYQGEFVEWYRDSRVAPPLPFTGRYRFTDGESVDSFCLDTFSKKNIYPENFEVGKEYIIYYKKGIASDVIVYVEEVEQT